MSSKNLKTGLIFSCFFFSRQHNACLKYYNLHFWPSWSISGIIASAITVWQGSGFVIRNRPFVQTTDLSVSYHSASDQVLTITDHWRDFEIGT